MYAIVADWSEHAAGLEALVGLQEEHGLEPEGIKHAVQQWQAHSGEVAAYERLRAQTGLDGAGLSRAVAQLAAQQEELSRLRAQAAEAEQHKADAQLWQVGRHLPSVCSRQRPAHRVVVHAFEELGCCKACLCCPLERSVR